jgi:hypothetical protein
MATAINLGCSESILSSWGAKTLSKLEKRYQKTTIIPHAHRGPVVIDKVRSGEYSLGLCAGHCIKAPELDYQEIGYEPFVIINPKHKTLMTIEDNSETWEAIEAQVKRMGLFPTKRLESFFPLAQLANFGSCSALVPLGVAKALGIRSDKIKSTKIKRPVILVARKSTFHRHDMKPIIEDFKTLILKELKMLN